MTRRASKASTGTVSSDAIVVGEEFLSEHYFASAATSKSFQARVIERRKQWDSDRAESPDHDTVRTRFVAERGGLETVFAELSEDANTASGDGADRDAARSLNERVRSILGYRGMAWTLTRRGGDGESVGPLTTVSSFGIDGAAPLVIIDATPSDIEGLLEKDADNLLDPYVADDGTEIRSVARLLSAVFVADDAPKYALVLAGGMALLTERSRWPEGRYLAVNLQLIAERNDDKRGGEVDRALTCLSAESLAPDPNGAIWWDGVIEESIAHTVGVSKDLREGVRLSIEIIANEVLARRRAQNLPELQAADAQPLARQSLRFLYRILFLLYAEASPELEVLPVGEPAYERGYSLDRLRELTLIEMAGPRARSGTHLFDSLSVLFRLIDQGHQGAASDDANDNVGDRVDQSDDDAPAEADGLTFHALRADLFADTAIPLIDEVKLGNAELQRVLRHLLLSKVSTGRDRGFISYAELGINQLGAVYEGLMSYSGFFADTDLYEVAPSGDPSKGSWVVPVDRADSIEAKDFVKIENEHGERVPVLHRRGTFVYRLSGRERQQSASYYTPEVLTRFTVGQALVELLDQNGETTSAEEILELTVCEPALGSGAFAIEAVRQLADEYLTRRQRELGQRIDPDQYPAELRKVKSYIALHQVYGVDLNATAVEFAEITLWLETMGGGLAAPWFGLHLRRGNSLVGARRAVVPPASTSKIQKVTAERSWVDVPFGADADTALAAGIFHFLLPGAGWGASADTKEGPKLAPERTKAIKEWRKSVRRNPTKTQTKELAALTVRAEKLWKLARRRLEIAESEAGRSIEVWGVDRTTPATATQPRPTPPTREAIEASLADEAGAYRRLRRVMDAWAALWFWPLTDEAATVDGQLVAPPTLEQWIAALTDILGEDGRIKPKDLNQISLADVDDWEQLEGAEKVELAIAQAQDIPDVLAKHPWLTVAERVAQQQGFFHWELDFAHVFANRGGFDLQVGNPPWVRPRSDVDALLAEGDPWFQLAVKPSQESIAAKREAALDLPGVRDLVLDGTADVASLSGFLGDAQAFPQLVGLQPNLYRCFMEVTWQHRSWTGTIGLIHPETHFTDDKAGALREATYTRLRRHWQFVNELQLFEIQHQKTYGVHIYGVPGAPSFLQAASLYHPDTLVRSLDHDGSGEEPGLKDPDGNWDVRSHGGRIITVNDDVLATWKDLLEADVVPARRARIVYTVSRSIGRVLERLSSAPRIGSLELQFSRGWDESIDRTNGHFENEWGPVESWSDAILQGPHLFVGTPLYKSPNRTMLHQTDWFPTDFEQLADHAMPVTAYKPRGDKAQYDVAYTHWDVAESNGAQRREAARDYYRIAWRRMVGNTGERTLIPALVPPGAAHVHTVNTAGLPGGSAARLATSLASASSLLADFGIRAVPKADILRLYCLIRGFRRFRFRRRRPGSLMVIPPRASMASAMSAAGVW